LPKIEQRLTVAPHAVATRGRRVLSGTVATAATIAVVVATLLSMAGGSAAATPRVASGAHAAASRARSAAAPLQPPRVPIVGAYVGADPNAAEGSVPTTQQAETLDTDIGRGLAIVSFYEAWDTPPPVADMSRVAADGALPMVSVHCGATDAAVAAGADDRMLRLFATIYKDYGGPVLFRWFWEMNLSKIENHAQCLGGGTAATQDAEYAAAFRHVWTIFHEVGATNVAFVWAPSAARTAPDAAPFYPGNAYVDWIGSDLYDRPGYGTWSSMYAPFYDEWSRTGKPLVLTETGAVGPAAQASWLANINSTAPSMFPDLHGIVYVDAFDLADYRLVPGTAGMAAYAALGADAYFSMQGPEDGYLAATTAGGVQNYGCVYYGSMTGKPIPAPIVDVVEAPGGQGYWLVGADGSVYAFGRAQSFGSMRGRHLNEPIRGIATTPDGRGYWMVAADGGIFTYGDARFYGSMGHKHLNSPIVGMAVGPLGQGYWLVASDGGVFAFGSAKFHGSAGAEPLNRPIVGMAVSPTGFGYWLVAADGGIFTYGDARYHGSLAGFRPGAVAAGIAVDPRTGDYRVATNTGDVYQFPQGAQLAVTRPPDTVVGLVTVN
jgi:hypothetical protein